MDVINVFFVVAVLFCCRTHFLLKNTVPHLVDIYAKNMDERGRNFMCKRTLPSLLVNNWVPFIEQMANYGAQKYPLEHFHMQGSRGQL